MITKANKLSNLFLLCMFCTNTDMEGKKKVNFEKPSIKIMTDPPSYYFETDGLKKSKQYYIHSASRVFYLKNSFIPIGDIAVLICDGNFIPLEVLGSYEKVTESLHEFWLDENIDRHRLENFNKL